MKKILFITLFSAMTLSAGALLLKSNQPDMTKPSVNKQISPGSTNKLDNVSARVAIHTIQPQQERSAETELLISEIKDNNDFPKLTSPDSLKTSWQISDSYISDDYLLAPAVTEKVSITIDTESVINLATGSSMTITLSDYSEHTAIITTVDENDDSKTITGFLSDTDSSQIILTAGKESIYATITTPEGEYSLQATNGKGLLYKVPPRSDIETIKTDALIADEH